MFLVWIVGWCGKEFLWRLNLISIGFYTLVSLVTSLLLVNSFSVVRSSVSDLLLSTFCVL